MLSESIAPGAVLLIEGSQLRVQRVFTKVDAAGLYLQSPREVATDFVSWTKIDRVSQLVSTQREWMGIVLFAVTGGCVLGRCGYMLDSLNGGVRKPGAAATGTTLGLLVGTLIASLIAFSRPARHWKVVYEATPSLRDETAIPLSERLEQGGQVAADHAKSAQRRRVRETIIAWSIFGLFLLALLAMIGKISRYLDF